MPRVPRHRVSEEAAAARYESLSSDPIDPLARRVGKAVVAQVKQFSVPAPAKGAGRAMGTVVTIELDELETRISDLIGKELCRSLVSPTAGGKELRMALIMMLASVEIGGEIADGQAKPSASDALLTTADVAAKLEVSRPYVSMLCDQGKLGDVVLTEGGHRRIRSSAVEAYLAARTRQYQGTKSPREAAVEAGLYDLPEGHFRNTVRSKPKPVPSGTAKAARKPRS